MCYRFEMVDISTSSESEAKTFKLSRVVLGEGERLPILLDQSGVPLWYPALFITTQVRNASKKPNTIFSMLSCIKSLLTWAERNGLSLEQRFGRREFLVESEIESLASYCKKQLSVSEAARPEVLSVRTNERARARIAKADNCNGSETQYKKITYAAKYIEWLAKRIVERDVRTIDNETLGQIKEMVKALKTRRPVVGAKSTINAKKGLTDKALDRLFSIIMPGNTENPFSAKVQKRNEIICRLCCDLGIRAGELLSLKVTDFDFQANTVLIARRHDDIDDPRANQPVAKTLDRLLPLTDSLSDSISSYVMTDRRNTRGAKRHSFLLVTHQVGPFQGHPLSMKGLSKVFTTIKKADPEALEEITAHLLRHTSNELFSRKMEEDKVPPAEEEKMRSYVMGWKEGSGSAATYTRRYTQKKAREAFLKLQQKPRNSGE